MMVLLIDNEAKIPHGCKFSQERKLTEEPICFSLGKTVLRTKPNELCLACIERELVRGHPLRN